MNKKNSVRGNLKIVMVVILEDSVEFEIKVSKNQLTIFFIEQEYLVLQKQ